MANERPWPITAAPFPLLNPTATTPIEINQNWAIINNYFQNSNNQQQPQGTAKPGQPGKPGKPGQGGGSGNIKEYDGASGHDTIPYVICNHTLYDWPNGTMNIGSGMQLAMSIDMVNGIVFPNRLVLPTT